MLSTAADLPDSIIRLLPDGFEMLDERAFQGPARGVAMKARFARDIEGVKNFPIDVELYLLCRGVADFDG